MVRFPSRQASIDGNLRWGLIIFCLVHADVGVPFSKTGSFCRHDRSSENVLVGIIGKQSTLVCILWDDGLMAG